MICRVRSRVGLHHLNRGACLLAALLFASLPAMAGPPLPAPAASGAPSAAASAAAHGAATAFVQIEDQGRVIAAGVVLDGDGRVLSAHPSLRVSEGGAPAHDVTIRYAGGARIRGRVVHADPSTSLALVVPLEGRRMQGVRASVSDPRTAEGHVTKAGKDVPVHFTSTESTLFTAEGMGDLLPGTAVLDPTGAALALSVRVCPEGAAKAPCTVSFAPVSVVRMFLSRTPQTATLPSAWLGIGGESVDTGTFRGVKVVAVAPASPALASGLIASPEEAKTDIILSVDGEPVATPEALGAKIGAHGVGDKVKLLVARANRLRDVVVLLKAAP